MEEQTTLSDNQRRFVCRIVFLVLCALPTFVVAYFLFHQTTALQWQNQIRAQLGIPVQIAAVETPVPFTTILREVRVPESFVRSGNQPNGDLLIDEIRINIGDAKNIVTVVQPLRVSVQSLSHVVERFMDHLGHIDFDHKVWRFEFAKIILTDGHPVADFDLKPVAMELESEPTAEGKRLTGKLFTKIPNLNADAPSDKSLFQLIFDNSSVEMLTGDGGIPVRLLRYWCPDLQYLGSQCRFQGQLNVVDMESEKVRAEGSLHAVELDRISTPYSPGIVGRCDVEIIHCYFEDNQIASANLRLHSSQPIKISSNLLMDARQLGIQTSELEDHTIYSFPNLDLIVDILEGRLIFSGRAGAVISKDDAGEAVMEVHPADISVNELAQVMIGDTYSEQAVEFLNKFRLPQRVAKDDGSSQSRF